MGGHVCLVEGCLGVGRGGGGPGGKGMCVERMSPVLNLGVTGRVALGKDNFEG